MNDSNNVGNAAAAAIPTVLAQKALEIALSNVGVHEQPHASNSGPEVDKFIQSVGLAPHHGFSWCMAFIYWCFEQAAEQLGIPNPAVKTGGCLWAWQHATAQQKSSTPSVGSIGILDLGQGHGHCFIVKQVINTDAKPLHTVEGNSNNDGSADGEAVVEHQRHLGHPIIGYLNY